MPNPTNIRPVKPNDLNALKIVIDKSGLFPSDMLDDMLAGYFNNAKENDFWLTYEEANEPIAIAYYTAEPMTEGTWNVLLIAVHPKQQSKGIGAKIMHHIEQTLSEQGQRVLLVETSGLDAFTRTRAFYLNNGYEQEARIREFYAEGEDKIIFRKALQTQ